MSRTLNSLNRGNELYARGERFWAKGQLKAAFRDFLASSETGFVPAFELVANFYDHGIGVKSDPDAALYWYRRAYRLDPAWHRKAARLALSGSANNIACILRDRGQGRAALLWFRKAVMLGDGDANLNIAKMYLGPKADHKAAAKYLRRALSAKYITDGSIAEAKRLLRDLLKQTQRRSSRQVRARDR